jgi:hypothetical protein
MGAWLKGSHDDAFNQAQVHRRTLRASVAVEKGANEMVEDDKHFRRLATVTYRSASGPIEVDFQFEELEELHWRVERGPD